MGSSFVRGIALRVDARVPSLASLERRCAHSVHSYARSTVLPALISPAPAVPRPVGCGVIPPYLEVKAELVKQQKHQECTGFRMKLLRFKAFQELKEERRSAPKHCPHGAHQPSEASDQREINCAWR